MPFRGNFQLKPCQLIGTGSRLRGKRTVQAGLVSKLWLRKGMRQIGYVPTWRGKAVIGQTRLYCSKGEGFRLVEVPTEQAANEAKRLNKSRLASRRGYSRLSVRVPASTCRGQQKHPEAPQGTNSSHRLKASRDKNPASIESTHSQHQFWRRSTFLQGFNR